MQESPEHSDFPEGSNYRKIIFNANGLHPRPVEACEWGEGFPYAPNDWPSPGDKWGWRVGKRRNANGYWADRYLYPPDRLQKAMGRRNLCFPSKSRVREYICKVFPNADVDAFFSSFQWRIPYIDRSQEEELSYYRNGTTLPEEINSTSDASPLHSAEGLETDEKPSDIPSVHQFASLKLENVINQVLQNLRQSQESEYKIAEQKLNTQKETLLSLYQQLDNERSEMEEQASTQTEDSFEDLCAGALKTMEEIKSELKKIRQMKQIAKGFGRTQKEVLKEHFGLAIED